MFLGIDGSVWDAVRNWATTIGGLIALSIATFTYRRNVKIKREEQARLVYSKVTHVTDHAPGTTFELLPNGAQVGCGSPGVNFITNPDADAVPKSLGLALAPLLQATVIIHNGSKELIGPAKVQLVNGADQHQPFEDISISVATVEPESNLVVDFTWINTLHPGMPGFATTVIFRDASGQWWRRHRSEPIERVHNDPENELRTPPERVATRAQQKLLGIPEEHWIKEPSLKLGVRLHRLIRKLRGKHPIP